MRWRPKVSTYSGTAVFPVAKAGVVIARPGSCADLRTYIDKYHDRGAKREEANAILVLVDAKFGEDCVLPSFDSNAAAIASESGKPCRTVLPVASLLGSR